MITFNNFLLEMARTMTRGEYSYIKRNGRYYKKDITNPKADEELISQEEYEKAKNYGFSSVIKNDSLKLKSKNDTFSAPIVTSYDKPQQFISYAISQQNVDTIEKEIKKANKLLSKCGLRPITYHIEKPTKPTHITEIFPEWCKEHVVTLGTHPDAYFDVWKVYITVYYSDIQSSSGYKYIATIDHHENLIYSFIKDDTLLNKIEKKFKKRLVCDHCGASRARSKTYIFQNSESGELVQIGTKCIKDYIPVKLDDFIKTLDYLLNPVGSFGPQEIDFEELNKSEKRYFHIENVIAKALRLIREDGFTSGSSFSNNVPTKDVLRSEYDNIRQLLSDEAEVKDVIKWINAQKESIYNNVKQILENGFCTYKSMAFIPFAVNNYIKSKAKSDDTSEKSDFIGNVKDKVKLPVTMIDYNTSTFQVNRYTSSTVYYYKFRDSHGNLIEWRSSNFISDITIGDKCDIEGTIKEHKEFRGTKYTVLTRCKISNIKSSPKSSKNDINIDMLYDDSIISF